MNWTYETHVNGIETDQTSDFTVRIDIEGHQYREWHKPKEEIQKQVDDMRTVYPSDKGYFKQMKDGAHATLTFKESDEGLILSSLKSESGLAVEPRHMRLIEPAAQELAEMLDVEIAVNPFGDYMEKYEGDQITNGGK